MKTKLISILFLFSSTIIYSQQFSRDQLIKTRDIQLEISKLHIDLYIIKMLSQEKMTDWELLVGHMEPVQESVSNATFLADMRYVFGKIEKPDNQTRAFAKGQIDGWKERLESNLDKLEKGKTYMLLDSELQTKLAAYIQKVNDLKDYFDNN